MHAARSSIRGWLVLTAVLVGFSMILASMLAKRYQQATHYPDYSSLRSDPQGTRALYEMLSQQPGVTVKRNFAATKKLEGGPGKVLLITSLSRGAMDSAFNTSTSDLARFAASGGRLILALDPSAGAYLDNAIQSAKESALLDELREQRRKRKPAKPQENKPKALPVALNVTAEKETDSEEDKAALKNKAKEWYENPPLAHLLKINVKGQRFFLTEKGGMSVKPSLALGLTEEQMPLWYSNLYLDDKNTLDYFAKWMGLMLEKLLEQREEEDRRDGIVRPERRPRATVEEEEKKYSKLSTESSPWVTLAQRGDRTVLAERQLGAGSVVLASDRFFLSNLALWQEPKLAFLSWLFGDVEEVIFEERSLGNFIGDEDGIMSLAKRYRMHGLFFGGLLFFLLYLWRNASTLVPRDERRDLGLWRAGAVAGRSAAAGLEGLLRRGTKPKELLARCFQVWESTTARSVRPERLAAARSELAKIKEPSVKEVPGLYAKLVAAVHGKR